MEERVNAITHGIGTALAIAALVLLIVFASLYGNAWHIVSFSIFGASLVVLYANSTLYHSFSNVPVKTFFRKLDHISIFVLIAGTYTPFCLTILRGWLGWTIFGVMWGCAATGIVFKALATGRAEMLSTILYVIMGWGVVFFIKPVYAFMSEAGFALLVSGGIMYTTGVFFFIKEKIKYNHGIWHVFVIAGSTLHFFSVLSLL